MHFPSYTLSSKTKGLLFIKAGMAHTDNKVFTAQREFQLKKTSEI